jgi:hypothetical protein
MLRISGQGMFNLEITSNQEHYLYNKKEDKFEFKHTD